MQTKLARVVEKILVILIICILTMGDIIVIAENSTVITAAEEQNTEEIIEMLAITQTLITSRAYKIGEANKHIVQIVLEIDSSNLQTGALKENQVTLTTPIEGVIPEEIYISEQEKANFVNATWEYNDGKVVINLQNEDIEKNKAKKIDKLVLTYVYAENTDISHILSKAVAEGKLYNGRKATSEESIYEVNNSGTFGEIIQVNSQVQDIYKTELKKENQEFYEIAQIDLNYKNYELMDKIVLSDNETKAYAGTIASEVITQYKETIINKQELLGAIGEDGELIISSEGNEICKINKDTETNEDGNIIINYEQTLKITIEITLGQEKTTLGKIENNSFSIIHKREIFKCDEKANFNKQIKIIDVNLQKGEEVSKFAVSSIGEIKNKITKVELGLDKQNLAVTQENEITATITMHTENKKYDLNKNPKFEIALPKEAETAELGNITILNNKDFKLKENQIVENSNGQKVVVIELEGEQTEYVEEAGNVQIIVPLEIAMPKLMPTTNASVELYYTNEKAESYETAENYGKEEISVELVAETDLIVATEGKIEGKEALSYKSEVSTIDIKKAESAQIIEVKGTVINNTEIAEENLYIIGQNELLSKITASKGNVYYSESAEGPWTNSFSEDKKYFKIEIEKLEVGEKVEFTYNMQIPEVLEESKNYEAMYKVYKAEELKKESKLLVEVEVEKKQEEQEKQENIEIRFNSRIQKYGAFEIEKVEIDSEIVHKVIINNKDTQEKDATIIMEIPACIDSDKLDLTIYQKTEKVDEEGNYIYSYLEKVKPNLVDKTATYQIKIPAQTEVLLTYKLDVNSYVSSDVITKINVLIDEINKEYISEMQALSPAKIKATMTAHINGKEIKTDEEVSLNKGEVIEYTTTIVNEGQTTEYVKIVNYNKFGFKRVKQQIYLNNTLVSEYGETEADIFSTDGIALEENGILKIVVLLELTKDIEEDREIENYSEIEGYSESLKTNVINIKLLKQEKQEPETPVTPEEPEQPLEGVYEISGVAWLDKNKNGEKEENEDLLKGIEVTLLNAETNNKIARSITGINGEYEFKDLKQGKYFVTFGYNGTTYNLTTYKKEGIEDSKNSDVILASQAGTNIAKTEIIELNNSISNIDIGLVLKDVFDLEVTKTIKQITVKNDDGQTVYEYKDVELAKIEIPSKYFKGTNLVIEYEIQIENKGDISGYVKTLTDHKPEGLKFASELNTSWYEGTEGNLYCIEFGLDEIKPGETRTVSLVLTKEINDTKIQYITNEVELEDVFNEYLSNEEDTSNNKAEATLIVAIKTGIANQYLGLWLACAVIVSTGIYLINKRIVIKR